ncbi:MAG TPA: ThuA domain-containing protein [Clostridia bacterium]|jgi:hypothetical protein
MKMKVFLSGDYTYPLFHPLTNVDQEIFEILGSNIEIALNTEHFETLEAWDYKKFDAVILYNDHWIDKSPTVHQQVQALIDYVVLGGGLVVIHNFEPGVDYEIAQMLGCSLKKTLTPYERRLIRYVPAEADHPILKDINSFEIEDELFDLYHDDLCEKTILLDAKLDNGVEIPMAWSVEFGLGRIVCTAPGHDIKAFTNPEYRKFLRNSVLWTAKRL